MNRTWNILKDVTLDVFYSLLYFLHINMRYFATLLEVSLPYMMYWIGQYVFEQRGYVGVGSEIFVPIVVGIAVYYIRGIANKTNKGTSMPIPRDRFTEVSDDGEVTVRVERTQELLLYMADLEDWMQCRGLL